PVEGLWLLSLDANTYRPNDVSAVAAGAPPVRDCTETGWNAALADKPHLLAWASDVARRAHAQGKTLIAFSHYPVVDPLGGSGPAEQRLLGDTGFVRRMPTPAVATALADTGIGVHFSGHWHINNSASHHDAGGHIVNIAVPSLVAFPAAFKIVETSPNSLLVETVPLRQAPGFDVAFPLYAAEARRTGRDIAAFLDAPDYATFLDVHLKALLHDRYLPLEWPADLARLVPGLTLARLADLAQSAPIACAAVEPVLQGDQLTLQDLAIDWYAIRKGADLALAAIPAQRLACYRSLIDAYGKRDWPADSLQGRLAALLTILQLYLARQPSADFIIDKKTGMLAPFSVAAPISATLAAAGT
ncbi:MAG TPA: hypothetical protein VL147_06930, partial [Devosia sp.]|nr:hypothetical protein [Devosia sp.]